jgi:hypothetical protein
LKTRYFLKTGGEVFGISKTNTIGKIADAYILLLVHDVNSLFDADIADEVADVSACGSSDFVVECRSACSHVGCKLGAVIVGILQMGENGFFCTFDK